MEQQVDPAVGQVGNECVFVSVHTVDARHFHSAEAGSGQGLELGSEIRAIDRTAHPPPARPRLALLRCLGPRQVRRLRSRVSAPLYLHCVNLALPLEIGAEDHPLPIGREVDVRFERIVMVLHVDQAFRRQAVSFGVEEIDPHPILGLGHLRRICPIAGKQLLIRRDVEVDGPFVPRHLVACRLSGLHIRARQMERHSSRDLQIVPDDLAIPAEEFVPCDLTLHRALVDFLHVSSLGVDRPDPIH